MLYPAMDETSMGASRTWNVPFPRSLLGLIPAELFPDRKGAASSAPGEQQDRKRDQVAPAEVWLDIGNISSW